MTMKNQPSLAILWLISCSFIHHLINVLTLVLMQTWTWCWNNSPLLYLSPCKKIIYCVYNMDMMQTCHTSTHTCRNLIFLSFQKLKVLKFSVTDSFWKSAGNPSHSPVSVFWDLTEKHKKELCLFIYKLL